VNYTSLLAGGPPAWQSFFAPLVSDACYSKKLEADDFHSCGKIFAAPAAVLAYAGGADDFLRWWVDFLADSSDAKLGLVCSNRRPWATLEEL